MSGEAGWYHRALSLWEDESVNYKANNGLSTTRSAWWRHQMEAFSALLAFVRGIHRSPVNSPHKEQWCGALMFSLICTWINSWVNNREAGDVRRHRVHYDVIVMVYLNFKECVPWYRRARQCLLMPQYLTISSWSYDIYMCIDSSFV